MLRPALRLCLAAALVVCCHGAAAAAAAAAAPVIISEPTSTRAVAFTSPTFRREPFPTTCAASICAGQRTRVMLFVMGLALGPGERASAVTARAEDGDHRLYDLTVEHVGRVAGYEWMSAVIVKLGDDVGEVGDVLVRLSYGGAVSNRVRMGIGRTGGGPADDEGATPTPAPPFSLGGFVRDGLAGLGGVSVSVAGAAGATLTTGADGSFALGGLPAGGRYTLTPAKPCYSFTPLAFTVETLYRNTPVNFAGAENRIDGRLLEAGGQPVAGSVALGGTKSAVAQSAAAGGAFSFECLAPGDYTVTPTHAHYDFAPASRTFDALAGGRRADFTATLKRHTVRGRVLDAAGVGLAGVAVTLTGARAAAATTDAAGGYSFSDLPSAGDYTVSAAKRQYDLSPASRTFDDLAADQTADFSAALSRYAISGRVKTPGGGAVVGATVTLTGGDGPPRAAATGADGGYSFAGVAAKGGYTVTASKTDYDFSPAAGHSFADLDAGQTADFTGIRSFDIRGRVTSGGRPLASVHVELTGSQTARAVADADGNFAFRVPAEGDYTVTPSRKHFYDYTPPAQTVTGLAADQVMNFSAAPVAPPATQYALEWDGSPKTVDHDYFFVTPNNNSDDLGHFFWEFWAMPGPDAGATYLLSDGYGGAHALLFGFGFYDASERGRFQLTGNVWGGDARRATTFSSDEGPAVGEWGHFAVGWDGREIVTYFNGVPVGATPYTHARRPGGGVNGAGRLLIGGSDHSNHVGRIAQVRGFENANPREDSTAAAGDAPTRAAYAPETVFRTGGQLLSNFFEPGLQTVADLSAGHDGRLHDGRLRGTLFPYGLLTFCDWCPRPVYVLDPAAPDFATATDRSPRSFGPPPDPAGVLAYDSFTRRNSTYALGGAGGLGSSERGPAGPQAWRQAPASPAGQPFGILNERAVVLANRRALAWLPLPPAPHGRDINVRRHPGRFGAGTDTGLCFRVADADNYFFAYSTGDSANPAARTLTVGFYVNGQRTELAAGIQMPAAWTDLRVVTTAAGAIRVYANSSLLYSTANGLLAASTGAGFYNDRPGLGLSNRWDDFTVYELPAAQARALDAATPAARLARAGR